MMGGKLIYSMKGQKVVPLVSVRALAEAMPMSAPEHLVALAEVGRELTAGVAIGDGIERALEVLDRRLGARRSALYTADPERRSLELSAAYGVTVEQFQPRYGLGVAGRVAESGRPIVVPTVHREPMALAELTNPVDWTESRWSLVSAPVSMKGRRVGALSAYFEDDDGEPDFGGRLGVLEVVASL
ncbi:MAG TPA: GAF domain-containing protein, partial [Polyangiaceae bacterium]